MTRMISNSKTKRGRILKSCALTLMGIVFFIMVSFAFQPPAAAERLQTQFTGENKCLDIVNDANDNQLIMADCGNFSGQFWKIR